MIELLWWAICGSLGSMLFVASFYMDDSDRIPAKELLKDWLVLSVLLIFFIAGPFGMLSGIINLILSMPKRRVE